MCLSSRFRAAADANGLEAQGSPVFRHGTWGCVSDHIFSSLRKILRSNTYPPERLAFLSGDLPTLTMHTQPTSLVVIIHRNRFVRTDLYPSCPLSQHDILDVRDHLIRHLQRTRTDVSPRLEENFGTIVASLPVLRPIFDAATRSLAKHIQIAYERCWIIRAIERSAFPMSSIGRDIRFPDVEIANRADLVELENSQVAKIGSWAATHESDLEIGDGESGERQ